ncbi:MAG: DEAD/DEAH box helicase [Myxococcota bacterium]
MAGPLDVFAPATRAWLGERFDAPTPVQARGWPLLAAGGHALLVAPTGSGKTLAAFLTAIDRLGRRPIDATPGVRVLYVSPLKALVADIERNLRAPIEGIAAAAKTTPEAPFHAPRVAMRTGDSSPRERRLQARSPAEILVTTPESLYLILGSKARETLATVETIIVDEIHALAGTKRGVHLALSLERVARRCLAGDPQRIGLSATARPTDAIARFLGGDREVAIVDASAPPSIELTVRVPVPDMTRPPTIRAVEADASDRPAPPIPSLWSAIHPALLEAIRASRSAIVFANSRALCERLAQALNALAGEPLVRAHHGSVAPDERREIETALAEGRLRAIVATSSLELGIDMASVERVLLVESPGAVARGLQRIGRAGHAVGETSVGVLFPKHRGDLLEAAVVARGMRAGEVESIASPRGALDVLAQQVVAIVAEGPTTVDEVAATIARASCYAALDRRLLEAVLDMLSGRYPSTDFAELRPRLRWDRPSGRLEAREGAARIALLSGGTIPDRGQYAVVVAPDGPRVGELDEEMVHETKPGDVVVLGATSWRVSEIGRDRVLVVPAPGEPGRLPFWRGDGPGRPIELGHAFGRYVREALAAPDLERWLQAEGQLDANAVVNLAAYLREQRAATGAVPHDRQIVIERFRDELGDFRVAIHSPFGARVHAPWALAIAERFCRRGSGGEIHPLWSDDGILLRFPDMSRPPETATFLPDPEDVESLVCEGLEQSSLFAAQFRENAARALLLPRRHARARTPLWSQRLRAQSLHAIARGFPDFPIMLETYRSCLRDVFDLPGLESLLRGIEGGEIAVADVETSTPSPFARSLVFAYTASFLYQPDLPAAERRSQALALDRQMLRELLGDTDWRRLLEPRAIDEVAAAVGRRVPEWGVDRPDGLHDRLRELGDRSDAALAKLHAAGAAGAARDRDALVRDGRALRIELAGESRWIAVEDAALYHDALGVVLPPALPAVWRRPSVAPLEQLVLRHARTHGPFTTEALAARFGLRAHALEPLLESLARRGRLVAGAFDPRRGGGPAMGSKSGRSPSREAAEWCEPEVLRRVKQRTLARLREEIAPVPAEVFARFQLDWQGITRPRPGLAGLEAALDRLEGLALPFAELEGRILPSRVPDYRPELLDRLGSEGRIAWLAVGPIDEADGRVLLCRRERLALEAEAFAGARTVEAGSGEGEGAFDPLEAAILARLAATGASFFSELVAALCGDAPGRLEAALFALVGRGLVTNDTFAPLRALGARRGPSASRPRSRRAPFVRGRRPGRHASPLATGGRWSLTRLVATPDVGPVPEGTPASVAGPASEAGPAREAAPANGARPARRAETPTERLHRRAQVLLDRHGIVSRDALEAEHEPGGFTAILPILRALEEAGRIRRGQFIQGGTSAQFALPGAVDRLRAARAAGDAPRAVLLASLDPAQPYGATLPWPAAPRGRPRRALGTSVVLVDGRAVLFVERGGRQIVCFGSMDSAAVVADERTADRRAALRLLARSVASLGLRRLSILRIDGEPALDSPLAPLVRAAGFRESERGFEADRLAPPDGAGPS